MRQLSKKTGILATISAVIVMMLGAASAAHAAVEMPLFYRTAVAGGHGNLVVAKLIQESVDHDPSGNAYIKGTPCLTPKMLLDEIHQDQPDVQVDTVADLPALYRSLIPHKGRAEGITGKVTLSRLVCHKPGSVQAGDHIDSTGWAREIREDEDVYYLPNHTEPFSAGDCTNTFMHPRKQITPPPPPPIQPCAFINADGMTLDTVRQIVGIPQGTTLQDSSCPVGIKLPGQQDFVPFKDTCPDSRCSVIQYQALTGKVTVRVGSEKLAHGGRLVIRVPAYFAHPGELSEVDLCLKQNDDGRMRGRQSCGQRIVAASYQLTHDNTAPGAPPAMNAYILYPDQPNTTGVGVVHWHWSDQYQCWMF